MFNIRHLGLPQLHNRIPCNRSIRLNKLRLYSTNAPDAVTLQGISTGMSQQKYAKVAAQTLDQLAEDVEDLFEKSNIPALDIDISVPASVAYIRRAC